MNSSSKSSVAMDAVKPLSLFDYRDMKAPPQTAAMLDEEAAAQPKPEERKMEAPAGPSPQEIEAMVKRARIEAVSETEKRLRAEYDARAAAESVRIREALEHFIQERKGYFLRVEAEIVKLSLAIAAKILHRESQVDPLLLMALVRVAVEKMQEGSKVNVRVAPGKAERWRDTLSPLGNGAVVAITEDAALKASDCILETDIGSANFSIDAQLKEIEQGFFDLLAQRPD